MKAQKKRCGGWGGRILGGGKKKSAKYCLKASGPYAFEKIQALLEELILQLSVWHRSAYIVHGLP